MELVGMIQGDKSSKTALTMPKDKRRRGVSPQVLGYALRAPLDTDGGSSIASAFVSNIKSGKDLIASWRDANDTAKGRNACVIDCSKTPHQFWFWDESSGSPVWTKKEKGTASW